METPSHSSVQSTNAPRWRRAGLAIGAIPVFLAGAILAVAEEPGLSAILARVQLLPVESGTRPPLFGGKAEPSEAWAEASSARFAKWVRHEDAEVSFLVPDDSRVRLEIKTPEDRIPAAGGPGRSGGIQFFRCYRLTFKGETYCLLLLDRQSEFDDNTCMCGHMAFEKYLQHHGALFRFALLENGQIKKIQVLGEGMRLVLFEWTHMPIRQEVYAQIALSIRWRRPPRDLSPLVAQVQKRYGKVGFLEKGMDRNAVVALLGPPQGEDRQLLRYVFKRSHDQPPGSHVEEVTWKIPLSDGKLMSLAPDWCKTRFLPPERNSVQWVLAKLDGQQGQSDSVEPASPQELRPLLSRVVELLPQAREEHWSTLCEAAVLLAHRGAKDARVPEIIKRRYLEPRLSAKDASEALRQYEPQKNRELFAKRIRLEMALARQPDAIRDQSDFACGWSCLKDLFGFLPAEYHQREALILEAIDHPHSDVRTDGYSCLADLPVSVARARLRTGLRDSCASIRGDCARALVELPASTAEGAEDLRLLHDQLAKEKDKHVLRALKNAIERLE